MNCPFLIGERLVLRPLDVSDLELCLEWINDPEVSAHLGRHRPMSRTMETEWLAGQYKSESDLSLAIALTDGDRHIGNVGLHSIDSTNRSAEFGILIGEPDARGQGYGLEASRLILSYAFDELGLHRVMLRVFPFNDRALRTYARLGFREEGRLRESYHRRGAFHDTILMSILESEWRTR
jgi:RimJ/RimL family protein N-acetyltransferase